MERRQFNGIPEYPRITSCGGPLDHKLKKTWGSYIKNKGWLNYEKEINLFTKL